MYLKFVLEYVKVSFQEAKMNYPHIEDKVIKSGLVYQYLCKFYLEKYMTLWDIWELDGYDMGYIGMMHSKSFRALDFLLGWSNAFTSHAILHDAFGRFYNRFKAGEGYTYAIRGSIPDWMKKSPFFGHITGINYCAFKHIIM